MHPGRACFWGTCCRIYATEAELGHHLIQHNQNAGPSGAISNSICFIEDSTDCVYESTHYYAMNRHLRTHIARAKAAAIRSIQDNGLKVTVRSVQHIRRVAVVQSVPLDRSSAAVDYTPRKETNEAASDTLLTSRHSSHRILNRLTNRRSQRCY